MSIDMSSFFGGGSSSAGGFGSASWLNDYASIKNGSYRRLMKAYYNENGKNSVNSSTKKSKSVAEDLIAEKMKRQNMVETAESKKLTAVKKATDDLASAVEKLRRTDSASVFEKKDITSVDEDGYETVRYDYDTEAIYNAVDDFVKSYNSVLSTAGATGNASIANRVTNIQNETKSNQQTLEQLGITINADNTLSIDKDTFMKADMSKAKSLFGEEGFYTKGVANSAALIRSTANYEQVRGNTYTYDGTYSSTTSVGNNYNSSL